MTIPTAVLTSPAQNMTMPIRVLTILTQNIDYTNPGLGISNSDPECPEEFSLYSNRDFHCFYKVDAFTNQVHMISRQV